jgi:hypothetical protein
VLPQANILGTTILSPDTAGYEYDVRATGYRYGAAGKPGVLLSNRAALRLPTTFTLPGLTAGDWVVRTRGVGGPDGELKVWSRHLSATVNASGQSSFRTPKRAIVDTLFLGPNLVKNGDFELGTVGSAPPTNWQLLKDTGVTASANLVADTTGAANGNNIVRLQKTAGAGNTALVQPNWVNSTIQSTIANNLNATFVLRANVRTSGLAANSVRLKAQVFGSGAHLVTSPLSTVASTNTNGLWETMEIEFVPAKILQGATFNYIEPVLLNNSSTGHVDIDGITLIQRTNTARNPSMLDVSPADNAADDWAPRKTGTASIVYQNDSGNTSKYVRLKKTVATDVCQLAQTHGDTSALGNRLNEKWRLKARVRYNGLSTTQGARLRVPLFSKNPAGGPPIYLDSSPEGPLLTTSSPGGGWVETAVEFNPRQLLGSATFDKAEIMLQNNSGTGTVDVIFMSLEAVD